MTVFNTIGVHLSLMTKRNLIVNWPIEASLLIIYLFNFPYAPSMELIQIIFSHWWTYWHLLHKTYNILPSSQVRPLNPAEHKHLSLLSVKPFRQVELFLQGFFAQALWCKNKKNSLNVLVRPIPLSFKSCSFWRCNIVIRLVKSISFQIHRLLIKIKT